MNKHTEKLEPVKENYDAIFWDKTKIIHKKNTSLK